MARLDSGDKAPTLTLADQDGHQITLPRGGGRRLVIYFYPKDDTPGCTTEARQFSEQLPGFEAAGIDVVGISPDGARSHARFAASQGIGFPLLSDPDHSVLQAYGAWGEKTMYGRTTTGVIRSTFLIDADGRVGRAWYNVRANGHAAKVLAEAEGG